MFLFVLGGNARLTSACMLKYHPRAREIIVLHFVTFSEHKFQGGNKLAKNYYKLDSLQKVAF